jgi:hypothetical protein
MQRDRALQIRMLREVQCGVKEDYGDLPGEILAYHAALLIDEGLVEGRAIRGANGQYQAASLLGLTNAGHDFLERFDRKPQTQIAPKKRSSMKIFISHATADKDLAGALASLFRAAFNISAKEIRCTSVEGYMLDVGTDVDSQLRIEVRESEVFVALITPASISSTYVLFELGARWGAELPLFPTLAKGATTSLLKGPLGGLHGVQLQQHAQLHSLIERMAIVLKLPMEPASTLGNQLNHVLVLAAQVTEEAAKAPTQSSLADQRFANEEIQILQLLHETFKEWACESVATFISVPEGDTQYYLDELQRKGLIDRKPGVILPSAMGGRIPSTYIIASDGRAIVMKLKS